MKADDIDLKWVLIILGIIIIYFARRNAGEYYFNKALVEIVVPLSLYFIGEGVIYKSRYEAPQVGVVNFTGSIGRNFIPVGDYAIFKCGEVSKPFHIEGKLATLIVPKTHLKKAGDNYYGLTFVERTEFLFVPNDVQTYLYNHKDEFNLNNIHFGKYSVAFIHAHEEVQDYEVTIKGLNKQINFRDHTIHGDNDILEETIETARALGEKKPFFGFLSRKPPPPEE